MRKKFKVRLHDVLWWSGLFFIALGTCMTDMRSWQPVALIAGGAVIVTLGFIADDARKRKARRRRKEREKWEHYQQLRELSRAQKESM